MTVCAFDGSVWTLSVSPFPEVTGRFTSCASCISMRLPAILSLYFMLAKDKSVEVDGYSGFVFTAKSGRPLMPSAVNNVLYNIVDVYNKVEVQRAKKEHRKAELLPKVSAHVMRHTACTRMAECRMDMKVLQYIMGHAHIDVTMEVYNHLGDRERIENEIARLDGIAVNF